MQLSDFFIWKRRGARLWVTMDWVIPFRGRREYLGRSSLSL